MFASSYQPPPLPPALQPLATTFLCSVSRSLAFALDHMGKRYHVVSVFLCLTSLRFFIERASACVGAVTLERRVAGAWHGVWRPSELRDCGHSRCVYCSGIETCRQESPRAGRNRRGSGCARGTGKDAFSPPRWTRGQRLQCFLRGSIQEA